jgi:hypothetical protein
LPLLQICWRYPPLFNLSLQPTSNPFKCGPPATPPPFILGFCFRLPLHTYHPFTHWFEGGKLQERSLLWIKCIDAIFTLQWMRHVGPVRTTNETSTVSFRDLDRRLRDDYFWANFDHFWLELHFLRQLGQ